MQRRHGMGFLFNAFEFVFAGGCLLGLNFILMFLFGLLRNFPAILDAARQALKEILKISYWAYRPIITRLQPVMHRYLGIQIEKTPVRILATSLLSLLLLLGFNLVLGWSVSIFFIVWPSSCAVTGFSGTISTCRRSTYGKKIL